MRQTSDKIDLDVMARDHRKQLVYNKLLSIDTMKQDRVERENGGNGNTTGKFKKKTGFQFQNYCKKQFSDQNSEVLNRSSVRLLTSL